MVIPFTHVGIVSVENYKNFGLEAILLHFLNFYNTHDIR
jgi:hypothetical protein